MTVLIWRQSRLAFLTAAVVLAAVAALLVINGLALHHAYQTGLTACHAAGNCDDLQKQLFRKEGTIIEIINLTVIAPAIIGMFLGAPLVARDLEQNTSKLIWTQAVTRRRWLLAKLGWLGLVAVAWSGAIGALVTWWSGPLNALGHQQLWPGQFDIQGIVPAAYSAFGFTLGAAAGVLVRRTVLALGITLTGFTAVRLLITTYLRPRYVPPATAALPPGPHTAYAAAGNWTLGMRPNIAIKGVASHGHVMSAVTQAGCHLSHFACLAAAGIRQVVTFQPGSRYWVFQGIEAAVYLILAAALVAAALTRLTHADG